jgi:hypothetical protein
MITGTDVTVSVGESVTQWGHLKIDVESIQVKANGRHIPAVLESDRSFSFSSTQHLAATAHGHEIEWSIKCRYYAR